MVKSRHPRRRRLRAALVVLGCLIAGAIALSRIANWLLEPQRLSAFLIGRAQQVSGLTITLDHPAQVALWPDLHIELRGLTVRDIPSGPPLLTAERIDTILPWRALLRRELAFHRLRFNAPALNLDAVNAWRARTAATEIGPPAPLQWPRLDASIEVDNGAVMTGNWHLSDLRLDTSPLAAGTPFALSLQGRGTKTASSAPATTTDAIASRQPFIFKLTALPQQDAAGIRLDQIHWQLALADSLKLQAEGTFRIDYPRALKVDMAATTDSLSALALAISLSTEPHAPVAIELRFQGGLEGQGQIDFHVASGENHISGNAALGNIAAWLSGTSASPLPPLAGHLEATRLQSGRVLLEGIKVQIEPDAPDASPSLLTPLPHQ